MEIPEYPVMVLNGPIRVNLFFLCIRAAKTLHRSVRFSRESTRPDAGRETSPWPRKGSTHSSGRFFVWSKLWVYPARNSFFKRQIEANWHARPAQVMD